ncbi:hypothetical protein BJX70DRAFT_403124 [Aspergillus crustosus]
MVHLNNIRTGKNTLAPTNTTSRSQAQRSNKPFSLSLNLSPPKHLHIGQATLPSPSTPGHASSPGKSPKPTWVNEEIEKERSFFGNTLDEHRAFLEAASEIPFPWPISRPRRPNASTNEKTHTTLKKKPGPASTSYFTSSGLLSDTDTEFESPTTTVVTTPDSDFDTRTDTQQITPDIQLSDEPHWNLQNDMGKHILGAGFDEVDYALWTIAERQREEGEQEEVL